MARWKLLNAHYLRVPNTRWEYSEVDRATGRQVRKQFEVPTLLDPNDPQAWTNILSRDMGEIIVCYAGKGQGRDIEFVGQPTPDMLPLDDEAKAISAQYADSWKPPVEDQDMTYSEVLVDKLLTEKAKAETATRQEPLNAMQDILAAMTQMMKQNQELIATLTTRQVEEVKPARRA